MQLDKGRALPIIKAALKEDIGTGDITTAALIGRGASLKASVITNEDCMVCGLKIAEWVMTQVDPGVHFKPNASDGSFVGGLKELLYLEGRAESILRAERTMLNFLSLLSGIATMTKAFVDKAKPYGVKVMDTRKTLPLLRYLEKYAVFTGGGTNHRMGLYDAVLIKDNHIKGSRVKGQGSRVRLQDLVKTVRKKCLKGTKVEIEVTSIEEFNDALTGAPDIIMLDNMTPQEARACVEIRRLSKIKPLLEVSGGVTLDKVEEYAKTKVDMISVGALTSSVKSVDMSLEIV